MADSWYSGRCRDCGFESDDLTIAEDHHLWVMDEDDLGFGFCDECIDELKDELVIT